MDLLRENDGFYIDLGTITYAQKAKRLLDDNGIASTVGKGVGRSMGEGCSYGVFVRGRNKEEVLLLLRSSGYKIY